MLVDESGTGLALGKAPVGLYQGSFGYEADPLEWLKSCAMAFEEAARATGLGKNGVCSRLRAVAVSGNGPTLVAVDHDGLPVGKASSWMDRSAVTQASRLSVATGRTVDPSFYLPKAMRMLETSAQTISRFFSGPEYLAFTLGARPVSYLADDYYDRYVWDRQATGILGLDDALFPPYVRPAERIGSVSVNASEAIGLPAGLPIISGFPDFLAALVGSGTVLPGIACDRSGSSEALNVCANTRSSDKGILSLPHAIPGYWNLSGGITTSGKAIEWFSAAGAYSGIGSDTMHHDAVDVEPGADGVIFLPYLAGERAPVWNPELRGAFLGLSLSNGRKHMARAVLESIACGLRLAADRIQGGGFQIERIRCSGGAARDEAMCTIKAHVLDTVLEVPYNTECEAMGDACACAVALGDHRDLASASSAMVRIEKRYEPSAAVVAQYGERYRAWKNALDALIGLTGIKE